MKIGWGGSLGLALGATALLGGLALPARRNSVPSATSPDPPAAATPAAPALEGAVKAPPGVEPTAELLLFLRPGADPKAYAAEHGLVHRQTLRSDPDAHVFGAADVAAARGHRGKARQDARVRRAYLNERVDRVKWAWVPDDPYYPNGSPSGFPGQWHLGNGAAPAADPRIPAAWARDVTGSGVLIGVVDDGLQIAHPDLSPNYAAADSWDFGQQDGDPSPVAAADNHGSSVAGVAAARGGNGVGGTGAAPLAGLAGLRIDFDNQTTAMFVDATLYHSSGPDTSVKVKNHSYGYSAPFVEAQAERDAAAVSAAAGTIHLYAAGNERGAFGEDSNKQDVQSSPDVIAVAALGSNGVYSPYSSFGANVFLTAPSNGVSGFGVTTTDRTGNAGYNGNGGGDGDPFPDVAYTSRFGGTSSATPLAAGVIALAKQARPALDVRFAKHLLVRTCRIVDAGDASVTGGGDGSTAGSAWRTNGAGFRFNANYGFGLIDADELTKQAALHAGVTPLQSESTGTVAVSGGGIPDADAVGITRTFTLSSVTPLEAVLVSLDVTHTFRGDLEAYLSSPSGTVSRLAYRSPSDGEDNLQWTFSSNAFWGEIPAGVWTLRVRDVYSQDAGVWNSFAATALMGELVVDATPPVVSSVLRAAADPTNAAALSFTVAFSKNVSGVDASDFAVAAGGSVSGASVLGVSGAGNLYTVSVNSGTGDGTLRLDVLDDDSVVDGAGNPLAAPFSAGEAYTIDRTAPAVARVRSTTPDGAYGAGTAIDVSVDFGEAVTLSGGNLRVTLSTGDVVSIPPFGPSASASGSYVVGAGDNSPDLDSSGALSLSAGTLRDAAGNDAVLAVPPGETLAAQGALVVDTAAPSVLRVRSTTPDGVYGTGAAVNVTVDFSEAVTLSGGDLRVTLSTGDVVTIAPFGPATSAAGAYTVGAGDNAADLGSGSPLALTGGTLRDAAGNGAALAVPAGQGLADLKNLVIDTAGPSVAIQQAAVQADPASAGPIVFTAVFSEPVSGFDGSDVSLAGSTAGGALSAAVSGSGTTYTVSVSGMISSGLVVASIPAGGAGDAAGNLNAASTSADAAVLFDVAPPLVTIERAPAQADPTNASPILFTVVFSEPVSGFATGDVTLGGSAGATAAVVSGGGATYTVSVSGMSADGTVVASIAAGVATDAAGNGNAASAGADNEVTYDATPPAAAVNQAVGQADPVASGPILFSVVFNEAVNGFDAGDVSFAGSTVGGTLAASVGGSGAAYTVSVTGMTGTGSVVVSLPAGAAVDAVGNPSLASTHADNVVAFDSSVPAVAINQAAGQADPSNGAAIVFDVLFSQPVNGFATGDVTFAGSTAGGPLVGTVSGASPGAAFVVTVTGMSSSGTVVASIPAGAASSASTAVPSAASTSADNAVAYDITPPSVTVHQAAGQADPTNASPVLFTVVFSEAVTGFAAEDVVLGGATTALVSGSGTTYALSVSGMAASGTVTAAVAAGAATDAAGNASAASTSADNAVAYDATPPAVTINQAAGQPDPANGASIVFTVLFSEPVGGFTTGDVAFAGSTVGGTLVGTVSGGGTSYTVTVTGMAGDGTVVASIPAGMALDAAGNPNAASTAADNVVVRDASPPAVTINRAAGQDDPTNALPILFTAVFSEPVSGFDGGDVLLSGATTATVSGGPTVYTVSLAGLSGSAAVTASIPAGAASDAAGNASAASDSTDNAVTYDVDGPSVTIQQAAAQADPTNAASILFTVTFSEPVSGFETGDVALGGSAGAASAVVSGGPSVYTVTVSGMTGDGTVTAAIGAGVAVDAAGNANAASTSPDDTVAFDGRAPTVTVEQAAGQADPTNAAPILFTAVFSEAVGGFGPEDVVVGGTAGGSASVSGGPTAYTIAVSGLSGDGKVVVTIAAGGAVDAAGNGNEASTSADNSVTYDATAPDVAGVSAATPDGTYGLGAAIDVVVVFTEPVTLSGGNLQVTLSTGDVVTIAPFGPSTTAGGVYTVGAGDNSADLGSSSPLLLTGGTLRDAAGNAGLLAVPPGQGLGDLKNLVIDTAAASVTINQAAGQADPTNASPLLFTVVFSEPVTGFAAADVVLGGAATALVSGSGTTYTVSVSGMAGDGTVTASVVAGAATDAAGNASAASTSVDNAVSYDATPPSVTINQAAGQADPTNASPILFTAVFSEPVSGFGAEDVGVAGAAGGGASVSGGPTQYTISISGMSGEGPVVVSIAAGGAVDAAGNGNEGSTSADNSVSYDPSAPGVSGVSAATPDGTYGPGSAITLTVAFSEPVLVSGTPSLTLETGASDAVASYIGGSGTDTLSFLFVVAAGHASADLDCVSAGALAGAIADATGNPAVLALPAPGAPGSLSAGKAIVVDGTPPLAGVVSDGPSGPDLDAQLSLTTISAHWSGFSDPESGVSGYEWAVGTTPGGEELRAFAPLGAMTSASTSSIDVLLALAPGTTCYVTVRATNGAGLTATATSDGITANGSDASPPLPPVWFIAVPADASILLEWAPSPSGDVASYRIWWKPSAAPWTAASPLDGVTGTSATILGLANGTAYDVMLKAVDAGENESTGVFASATPAPAVAIGGTAFGSIQEAIDAAAPGETVSVGPGTFAGDLDLRPGVGLEGTSPRHTIISGAVTVEGAYPGDPTSTISNLTVANGAVGVDAGTADVLLHHVVLRHATGHGATGAAGGRLRALNCTIVSNGGDGLRGDGVAAARNNIVGKNGGTGIAVPAGSAVDYNAIYGNAVADLPAGVAGTGNHGAAAHFEDEAGFDYTERSASPSVDAGDPADGFSNEPAPNGGRINQGAYGDTPWAARTPASRRGGGGGGGGSCGALGIELLLPFLAVGTFRRRRVIPI